MSDLQGTWSDEEVVLFDVFFFFFFSLSLLETQTKIRIWHFSSDILRYCHSPTLAGLPAWISKGSELSWCAVSSTPRRSVPRPADTEFSQRLSPSSGAHEVVNEDPSTFVSRHSRISIWTEDLFCTRCQENCVDRGWIRAWVEPCQHTFKTFLCVLNIISGTGGALQSRSNNK